MKLEPNPVDRVLFFSFIVSTYAVCLSWICSRDYASTPRATPTCISEAATTRFCSFAKSISDFFERKKKSSICLAGVERARERERKKESICNGNTPPENVFAWKKKQKKGGIMVVNSSNDCFIGILVFFCDSQIKITLRDLINQRLAETKRRNDTFFCLYR